MRPPKQNKTAQEGPQTAPRIPRWLQRAVVGVQEEPKMDPRKLPVGSTRAPRGRRLALIRPVLSQRELSCRGDPHEGPKRAPSEGLKRGPRSIQEGPKMDPRELTVGSKRATRGRRLALSNLVL